MAWSAFERFGQLGCAFVVQLVLARLLAPEQFGLIAMVTVFITISNVLIDAGFSRALIQRKKLTDLDVTSVFYFNLLVSILLALFLYAVAPAIAQFYEAEELTPIVRILSVSLIFSGLGAVHQAKLSREMKFKKLFYVSFPATLVGGIVETGGVGAAPETNAASTVPAAMVSGTRLYSEASFRVRTAPLITRTPRSAAPLF